MNYLSIHWIVVYKLDIFCSKPTCLADLPNFHIMYNYIIGPTQRNITLVFPETITGVIVLLQSKVSFHYGVTINQPHILPNLQKYKDERTPISREETFIHLYILTMYEEAFTATQFCETPCVSARYQSRR